MIYDGPPSRMLPALVTTIRGHLASGLRCMYMNSPAMAAGLRSQLYAVGVDVQDEVTRGALVIASDSAHLVNGRFDIARMIAMLDDAATDALASGYRGLFATGDMTWEFGPEKDFARLLEYEWQLEELFKKHPSLSGICQYHRDLLPAEAARDGFVAHEQVYVNETLSRLRQGYVAARSAEDWKAPQAEDEATIAALLAVKSRVPSS